MCRSVHALETLNLEHVALPLCCSCLMKIAVLINGECRKLRAELGPGEGVTALLENSERALQIGGLAILQVSQTLPATLTNAASRLTCSVWLQHSASRCMQEVAALHGHQAGWSNCSTPKKVCYLGGGQPGAGLQRPTQQPKAAAEHLWRHAGLH